MVDFSIVFCKRLPGLEFRHLMTSPCQASVQHIDEGDFSVPLVAKKLRQLMTEEVQLQATVPRLVHVLVADLEPTAQGFLNPGLTLMMINGG